MFKPRRQNTFQHCVTHFTSCLQGSDAWLMSYTITVCQRNCWPTDTRFCFTIVVIGQQSRFEPSGLLYQLLDEMQERVYRWRLFATFGWRRNESLMKLLHGWRWRRRLHAWVRVRAKHSNLTQFGCITVYTVTVGRSLLLSIRTTEKAMLESAIYWRQAVTRLGCLKSLSRRQ